MLFRKFHGLPVHIGFNRHEEFVFQFLFDSGFKLLSQFQRCLRPHGNVSRSGWSCCRRQTSRRECAPYTLAVAMQAQPAFALRLMEKIQQAAKA